MSFPGLPVPICVTERYGAIPSDHFLLQVKLYDLKLVQIQPAPSRMEKFKTLCTINRFYFRNARGLCGDELLR